ncbi:cytochrome P450 [Solibacillus silvestris StLB046]|uniref:Cytochrome P450 n=1 Tax=Solibacillus silvestris (strain StLB046) TaxID=1002809 RepID=F2F2C0_SOLSS|nr:cytochrome P450 [Solibacillus silvestris]BAK15372.1 cytochrome P450 [Solibacillus silvestris StLB046]
MTNSVPKEEGIDHSLNLLREGYLYILNRRQSFHSDLFETRLLGKKAVCMGGKEAADLFYDNSKFKRAGVAPNRVAETLFGKKGVQTLDGDAHKHRKKMFMSIMSQDRLKKMNEIAAKQWDTALTKWQQMDDVVLYEEALEIMCRSACEWAGVPVEEKDMKKLADDFRAMFESATAIGPSHWAGRHARNRVEKWMGNLIDQVREGKLNPEEGTALYTFSWHRDLEGNLLDPEVASVEVINILRPIVAIAVYITFSALAAHHYPEERKKLQSGNEKNTQMFVQEVRRFYPFFPFAAAEVKADFTWKDYTFEKGTLTLLDLYGTNHDTNIWGNPEVFQPSRFENWDGSPFSFIPQGGGDYYLGHRCAGEWVTIEMMKVSLDFLVNQMTYDVPEQDLSYSKVSIPSLPKSKVMINNVQRVLR